MSYEYDYLIKLLIIGNSNVGKSSIMLRFTDDIFKDVYFTTIGVDFKIRLIHHNDKVIKLQIWDTAGQERFRSIITSYYRGAHGIILVYDITDQQSFDELNVHINNILAYANPLIPIMIVGNKIDLESKRIITYEMGKNFADLYNYYFIETSAKNSLYIDTLFSHFTQHIINYYQYNTQLIQNPTYVEYLKKLPRASIQPSNHCC